MVALAYRLAGMSVDEFLSWTPHDSRLWQLVDGEPRMMAPPSTTHGLVQAELARIIGNHLLATRSRCRLLVTPGVIPRVHANHNMRIPDLAVSCARQPPERPDLVDPLLIVEVLSPSNEAKTWSNVWAYTTIPSVREIVVLRTDTIAAEILHRAADGSWPAEPDSAEAGASLVFDSIALQTDLTALYRGTSFNPD